MRRAPRARSILHKGLVGSPLLLETHSVPCPGALEQSQGEELLKEFALEDCVQVEEEPP